MHVAHSLCVRCMMYATAMLVIELIDVCVISSYTASVCVTTHTASELSNMHSKRDTRLSSLPVFFFSLYLYHTTYKKKVTSHITHHKISIEGPLAKPHTGKEKPHPNTTTRGSNTCR